MAHLRTTGRDNGIFSYELETPFERTMANLYYLCVSEGLNGIMFDYTILKDYSGKLGWDAMETLVLLRGVTARVKEK